MSIISEINNLHVNTRSILLLIVMTSPFWYATIFVISPTLITQYPFYISLVFSYCFTVCWLIISAVSVGTWSELIGVEFEIQNHFGLVFVMSIFWLLTSVIIGYLCRLSLFSFLCWCFGFGMFRFISGQLLLTAKNNGKKIMAK